MKKEIKGLESIVNTELFHRVCNTMRFEYEWSNPDMLKGIEDIIKSTVIVLDEFDNDQLSIVNSKEKHHQKQGLITLSMTNEDFKLLKQICLDFNSKYNPDSLEWIYCQALTRIVSQKK